MLTLTSRSEIDMHNVSFTIKQKFIVKFNQGHIAS